jgi:hypothetical protein
MTSSSSSSSRRVGAALVLGLALGAAGCAGGRGATWPGHPDEKQPLRVALLPPENLTGGPAPVADIERAAERALARIGVEVVSGAAVDEFLGRHRLRYTGGLDREAAQLAREELGVSAAVITSIVMHGDRDPPRVGVIMRLVSAAEPPEVLWMDGFGRTGDDSPGFLGLGIVENVRKLHEEAFDTLARSLAAFLRDARRKAPSCPTSDTFAPRIAFRSPGLMREDAITVAVLPFVNETGRRGAGQVLALEMARQLRAVSRVRVIEPGMLREELLTYRVTTEGGASLPTVRLLSKVLEADLIVGGVVRDYDDANTPVVGFSAIALDPRTEETVWESTSHNNGSDSMWLFGAGTVSTANVLACRMTRAVVGQMMQRRRHAGRTNARALAHGRRGHAPLGARVAFGRALTADKTLN